MLGLGVERGKASAGGERSIKQRIDSILGLQQRAHHMQHLVAGRLRSELSGFGGPDFGGVGGGSEIDEILRAEIHPQHVGAQSHPAGRASHRRRFRPRWPEPAALFSLPAYLLLKLPLPLLLFLLAAAKRRIGPSG